MSAQEEFRRYLQGRPEIQPTVDENRLGVMWVVACKAEIAPPQFGEDAELVARRLLTELKDRYGE